MTSPINIGFCGIGLMGAPIVRRLLAAGHTVHVWNRTRAKAEALVPDGAILAESPAEVARNSRVVVLCLTDRHAVEATVFGAHGISSVQGPELVIDHSSIAPDATRAFAARLNEKTGAGWIDAPVSGGVGGATAGTLAIMGGGDERWVPLAREVVHAYSSRYTHMGGSGAGQVTKLCNQTIVASTLVAIGEAVALAQSSGLDASKLTEALAGGWADSTLLQIFVDRMVNPPEQSIGAVATMLKDVDNVAQYATTSATPMPVLSTVQQCFRIAANLGLAQADLSQVVQVSRPRASVEP